MKKIFATIIEWFVENEKLYVKNEKKPSVFWVNQRFERNGTSIYHGLDRKVPSMEREFCENEIFYFTYCRGEAYEVFKQTVN